jgi:regulatory protein
MTGWRRPGPALQPVRTQDDESGRAPTDDLTETPEPRRLRPEPSLKARALKLLSMREHSRLELERKLREHETREGELAEALDALAARGFISDERVADSVLHRRAGKLGASRVKAELQAKGLDEAVVREAVEQLRGTEVERAREVWRRKFGHPPADAAERVRQMRFLAARGFSGEAIRKSIEGADEFDAQT